MNRAPRAVHQLVFVEGFDRPEPDGAHWVELAHAEPWIRGKTVLNIGCWTGNFELVAAHLPRRLTSLEINLSAVRAARQAVPTVTFVNGDLFRLPFRDGTFEVVLLLAVIEHIGSRELEALGEIRRVLAPGGRLVLSTPHQQWFHDLMDVAHWLVDHRHYSREAMAGMLEATGFRLLRLEVLGRTLATASLPLFYLCKYLLRWNIYRNPTFQRWFVREHQRPGYRDIYLVAERGE